MTIAAIPRLAFTQEDSERAFREWKANCGPNALAAILGMTLDALRPHLAGFEARGYMNPTMMGDAPNAVGAKWRPMERQHAGFPGMGLVRIQWGGSWMKPGVPKAAAYGRTHWIASALFRGDIWVFDVNGGWRLKADWEAEIVPLIVASIKRADGTWFPTHRWEVVPCTTR